MRKSICFVYCILASALFSSEPQSHFCLKRDGYSMDYDSRLKQPSWVFEVLSLENIKGEVKRSSTFIEDKELPKAVRTYNSDYKKSGFDRGHMAPAADHKQSKKAMQDTFLLSNISPQVPQFNRGIWAKLEEHARELVIKYGFATVITGPLFLPETREDGRRFVTYEVIGDSNIAVPTHYFKVIFTGHGEYEAYIIPNQAIDLYKLDQFKTAIQEIEEKTGVVF